ncbi:hypothetical protein [Bacteroides sp.]|nr:hypothetical protein [Bacteroides sp.]
MTQNYGLIASKRKKREQVTDYCGRVTQLLANVTHFFSNALAAA